MIVAAGQGTRLRPLTDLRPKPALPVRGIPLIAYTLALLRHHGVREVVVNLHHHPEALRETAERWCPEDLELHFSPEPQLLDTGGGIRRVARFLQGSDPCLLLGGDMILDADLGALVRRHQEERRAVTLLLREDPRAPRFGTIGVDREGRVRRIAGRFDLGGSERAGVYVWANVVSAAALDTLPEREVFSHLDDWLAPRLAAGARDVVAEVATADACLWEPVGTPAEYLEANLRPVALSYWPGGDARARASGTRFEGDVVIGSGAELGVGARLRRAVVWDGEKVPAGFEGEDGVWAGGAFHACHAEEGP